MKQMRLFLTILMAIAFMPRAWAETSWTNTHVFVKDVNVNGVAYQLCHVYTREAKIVEVAFTGGYQEYSTNLTEQYYASVLGIEGSGEVEIPGSIFDGNQEYQVKYIGVHAEQSYHSAIKEYTYYFMGTNTAYTTCEYYNLTETPCTVNAPNATKLTFMKEVTFKGTLSAPICTDIVFRNYARIKGNWLCPELTSIDCASVFTFMNGSGLLTCPKLREITFHGVTPTFTGGWSDYCTAPANYITVYLNESQDVCNHLHQYSTVWSEFKAVSPLPDQTNPNRNVSFTIKGGRVKVGDSSTYILSDANYQVEQFSDFTFQVTKLYGSDYLVKSVKINGEEMLDAMTLTQGATDALSYYSYTISPVINDVHISVEGESIYDRAYAICSVGGTCKWSTQSLSIIMPNQNSSIRWLKSSETPPSLIIVPSEGFTLDRFYYNNYDNTYRVTDNGDGTYAYEMAADAKVSVVFKELPPTTTWNVSLLNNEQSISAKMIDKRTDEYTYTLTDGENVVLDKPKSITMRIDGTGTPMVVADGVDISSCFTLNTEWFGEMDEYGNPITVDYYSGEIPAECMEAQNWVIGLSNESQKVWAATLKGEADGGSFALAGGSLAGKLNLSNDNREGIFVDNASNPTTIAPGFNLTSTLAVPKGYTFSVKFNETDLSDYYTYNNTTESAVTYDAVFDGSQPDLSALVCDGTWVIEFAKSTADIIAFADANVKAICVKNWDTDRDGELSKAEAAAVTTFIDSKTNKSFFRNNTTITSFDELQYFTGLTKIGKEYFHECRNLKSVILPSTILSIDEYGFYACGLEFIRFPSSLTTLGHFCFNGSSLKTVYVPKTITNIGTAVFSGHQLLSIAVDPENTLFDSRSNCNAIIRKSNNYLIAACDSSIIPETAAGIGPWVFSSSSKKEINIPASVSNIAAYAFNNCFDLRKVVMNSRTPFQFSNSMFSINASGSYEHPVLVVPKGTKTAYADKGWKSVADGGFFKDVVEAAPEAGGLLGDVNNDGKVTIADVTALVNIILGK